MLFPNGSTFKPSESSHLHGKLKKHFFLWCVVNVDYPGVKFAASIISLGQKGMLNTVRKMCFLKESQGKV
jgi:hypothetical protein